MYGDDAITKKTAQEGFIKLKNGIRDLQNAPRCGRVFLMARI